MGVTGSGTIDFGAAPGNQRATTTIIGQTDIVPSSVAEAFIMAEDSADHNAYEHEMVDLKLTCGNVVNGVGFDVVGVSEWSLTGIFNFKWVWV